MEKKMTLQGYLNNPAGTGSAAITNRELVKNDLSRRFEELYKRKTKLFVANAYKYMDEYFIHVTIPSESTQRDNTYDVVVKFSPDNASDINTSSVTGYNISLFSNSPSFTFTYTYVYDKDGLLVEELRDKYRDETFSSPVVRNPYEAINYEKTTFFALMYILKHRELLSKVTLNSGQGVSHLKKVVRTADKISIEIGQEKRRIAAEEAEKKTKEKKKQIRDISIPNKPKKPVKPNRITPTKPKAKVKPKPKVSGRSALKSAVNKRKK